MFRYLQKSNQDIVANFERMDTDGSGELDAGEFRAALLEMGLGMSDEEINAWLLDSAAYISSGQVQRLADGGDHHDLLGITEPAGGNALDDVVDTARQKMTS